VETLLQRAREVRQSLTSTSSSARGTGGGAGSGSGGGAGSGIPGRAIDPREEDNAPMREVPPPIELASDLAPEPPIQSPPRDDSPPEHMLMLERLNPAHRYPS
jgi:hypothetical protein